MSEGFGKPKYGNGGTKIKTFKIKTGPNVYRYLPPMKSLAREGRWSIYYGVHFGYAGVDRNDPTKTKQRPFMCIEDKNYRSGIITVRCEECDKIRDQESVLKDRSGALKAQGMTDDDIDTVLAPLKAWLKSHNCDRKHYINVMNPQGEFGTLMISHKTKKLVDAEFQRLLNEEGIDALDLDQGVWVNIERVGEKIQAQDSVKIVQENITLEDGRKVKQIKLAPLTPAQQAQALSECPDLTEVVRRITAEQIHLLVTGSGDPEEVDNIWAMGQKREASPAPAPRAAAPTPRPAPTPTPTPAPAPAPQAAAPAAPAAPDLAAQIAALQAQLAAAQAAQAAPAPAPAPTPAPTNAATPDLSNMTDEEFVQFMKSNRPQ